MSSSSSSRLSIVIVVLWLVIRGGFAGAQEWPRFRGPNGSGIAVGRVPTSWTAADYNWQIELPGTGHSSPVLWGKLLVATCANESDGTRTVLGLDAETGRQLWRTDFASEAIRKHKLNSLASATPALDERHAYVCWATPEAFLVIALDHSGSEVWRRDLGSFQSGHGDGVSPIVHGESVIVAKEHQGESEIVALDRASGTVRWSATRKSRATWATPCVHHADGGEPELIVVNYEHGITSLDPETGSLNWEIDVFDKGHVESTIGSPVIAGDLILGGSGWLAVRQEVVAVRPTRRDGRTGVEQVYCIDRGAPLCTTPLVVGDLLFLWADEGVVTCADAMTGRKHWTKRVGGTFYASPVAAGEHVFNVSAEGEAVVLAASPSYQLVARNDIGEPSHSTPAIVGDTMYIRTFSKLMSLGGDRKQQ